MQEEELDHVVEDGSELGYLSVMMQEAACAVRKEAVVNVEVAQGDHQDSSLLSIAVCLPEIMVGHGGMVKQEEEAQMKVSRTELFNTCQCC